MWNRHDVTPSDKFFNMCHFFIFVKNAKNGNRLCPLPYEEVLGQGCTILHRVKPG